MTLDKTRRSQAAEDFAQAMEKTQLSVAEIAADLRTSPEKIEGILEMRDKSRENVWILRNYFLDKDSTLEFMELRGNATDYWFLDQQKIEGKQLS